MRAFVLRSSLCNDKELLLADKTKPKIKLLFHERVLPTVSQKSPASYSKTFFKFKFFSELFTQAWKGY